MKSAVSVVLLCLTGVSLAGCGSTMRGYLEKDTPTEQVAVRQDLTMPPDLRLPPPGTTAAAPDTGALNAQSSLAAAAPAEPLTIVPGNNKPVAAPRPAAPAPVTTAATTPAASGPDAIYVNAGISLTNPDGSRKTDQQLREELQAYYLAQKKAKNASYGTVFNMGNIFKDE